MKTLITALALVASAPVAAQWSVQINGLSHHASSRDFRKSNPGLGLRYQFTPAWSAAGGFYRNSYDRRSTYLVGQWEPLALGPVRAGVFAGYVSGYTMRYPLAAGFMLTTQTQPVSLTVRLVPGIGKHTTTLSFELGVSL